jgi:hypothetical protein
MRGQVDQISRGLSLIFYLATRCAAVRAVRGIAHVEVLDLNLDPEIRNQTGSELEGYPDHWFEHESEAWR